MQRKLIRVGTSAAVLIPKEVLRDHELTIGDMVYIDVSKHAQVEKKPIIDPQIVEWTDRFIQRHRMLLKKLAKA